MLSLGHYIYSRLSPRIPVSAGHGTEVMPVMDGKVCMGVGDPEDRLGISLLDVSITLDLRTHCLFLEML